MAGVLCAGGALAQEACFEPTDGPAGSEICDLGVLSGGDDSTARGVNADGTVVVGRSDSSEGTRAFRWVEGTGMESLGVPSGGSVSGATGVSADGTVVVGYSSEGSSTLHAVIWRAAR